jgi:hypothetical protein
MQLDEMKAVSLLPYIGDEPEFSSRDIRQRIAGISKSFHELLLGEIAQARVLLNLDIPDLAGAYFHICRALEGYLESVIVRPSIEALLNPLQIHLARPALRPHQVLARDFIRNVRNAAIRSFGTTAETDSILSLLDRFENPTAEDVLECEQLAINVATRIEELRKPWSTP